MSNMIEKQKMNELRQYLPRGNEMTEAEIEATAAGLKQFFKIRLVIS